MLTVGIAQYLDSLGIINYDAGANSDSSVDWLPNSPNVWCALLTSPGGLPDAWLGYDWLNVQVFCRGEKDSPETPEAWAREIFNALQGLGPTELPNGTTLINCYALGAVAPVGNDSVGRPSYGFNLRVEYRNLTTHRE